MGKKRREDSLEDGSAKDERKPNRHNHFPAVIVAWISVVLHIVDTITDYILVYDYYMIGASGSAIALLIIRALMSLTMIQFDFLNRGRVRYFLLDILQLRVLVELYYYMIEWKAHKGRSWLGKEFRQSHSFESFLGSMPSLVVQVHVLIQEAKVPNSIQIVSLVATCLVAFMDLLNHFKYTSLSGSAYVLMMLKAMFNTAIRTPLAALLVIDLKAYFLLWLAISYLAGLLLYYINVRRSRLVRKDDPIKYPFVHCVFANLVAQDMLFVSFPFAPNHAIKDWWFGYLLSETKIQLENVIMLIVVGLKHDLTTSSADLGVPVDYLFYSAVFFACSSFIANFVLLGVLHHKVSRQLRKRAIYSSPVIVKLFVHICAYTSQTIKEKKEVRRTAKLHKGMTFYQDKAVEMANRKASESHSAASVAVRDEDLVAESVAAVNPIGHQSIRRDPHKENKDKDKDKDKNKDGSPSSKSKSNSASGGGGGGTGGGGGGGGGGGRGAYSFPSRNSSTSQEIMSDIPSGKDKDKDREREREESGGKNKQQQTSKDRDRRTSSKEVGGGGGGGGGPLSSTGGEKHGEGPKKSKMPRNSFEAKLQPGIGLMIVVSDAEQEVPRSPRTAASSPTNSASASASASSSSSSSSAAASAAAEKAVGPEDSPKSNGSEGSKKSPPTTPVHAPSSSSGSIGDPLPDIVVVVGNGSPDPASPLTAQSSPGSSYDDRKAVLAPDDARSRSFSDDIEIDSDPEDGEDSGKRRETKSKK